MSKETMPNTKEESYKELSTSVESIPSLNNSYSSGVSYSDEFNYLHLMTKTEDKMLFCLDNLGYPKLAQTNKFLKPQENVLNKSLSKSTGSSRQLNLVGLVFINSQNPNERIELFYSSKYQVLDFMTGEPTGEDDHFVDRTYMKQAFKYDYTNNGKLRRLNDTDSKLSIIKGKLARISFINARNRKITEKLNMEHNQLPGSRIDKEFYFNLISQAPFITKHEGYKEFLKFINGEDYSVSHLDLFSSCIKRIFDYSLPFDFVKENSERMIHSEDILLLDIRKYFDQAKKSLSIKLSKCQFIIDSVSINLYSTNFCCSMCVQTITSIFNCFKSLVKEALSTEKINFTSFYLYNNFKENYFSRILSSEAIKSVMEKGDKLILEEDMDKTFCSDYSKPIQNDIIYHIQLEKGTEDFELALEQKNDMGNLLFKFTNSSFPEDEIMTIKRDEDYITAEKVYFREIQELTEVVPPKTLSKPEILRKSRLSAYMMKKEDF